jgi:hypothetical protein
MRAVSGGRVCAPEETNASRFGINARVTGSSMVWWTVMSCFRIPLAAAAGLTLLALGMPSAAAAPDSDDQGYLDSTARCSSSNTAVEFGSTEASRVAICQGPDGDYQYRGVRVRDGARLILSAERTDSGAFVAENDGVEYTVAAKSLIISVGEKVIREEPWVDFHSPNSATTTTPSTSPTKTAPLPPPLPAEEGGGG